MKDMVEEFVGDKYRYNLDGLIEDRKRLKQDFLHEFDAYVDTLDVKVKPVVESVMGELDQVDHALVANDLSEMKSRTQVEQYLRGSLGDLVNRTREVGMWVRHVNYNDELFEYIQELIQGGWTTKCKVVASTYKDLASTNMRQKEYREKFPKICADFEEDVYESSGSDED